VSRGGGDEHYFGVVWGVGAVDRARWSKNLGKDEQSAPLTPTAVWSWFGLVIEMVLWYTV